MRLVKLKEVAVITTGFPFKSNFYTGEGVRVVRGENVTEGKLRWDSIKYWDTPFEKFDEYSLKENDIVIGMDGSKVGKNKAKISKDDLPLLLAQRVACVRAFKNTNQNYLFYCINSKRFEDYVFRIQTGSSVPHISKAQIEEYPIPDIELSTQSKVAKILSDLDRKIQINNQINSEIESMTRLIFDYWFIQFDFPDEKGKPYKSSGGKMVYNDELNSYIPEFWKVNALINISKITTGKLDSNAEVAGGKYPFFTCAKKPVTIDNFKYDGDVILIAGNNANGNFHVNRYSGKFNAYQRTYIVSANSEEYLNYLHQVLLRQMKIYKHRGRGSQTKFLTIGMLTEIQLFEPKDNLMYEYHKITAPLHEKQMHILRENKELESMRDWLLPMLMNGQVTVKSA